MNELTCDAYAESAVTCELCGEPGTLHRSRIGWATTLCGHCALASDRGYRPADETVQELTPDLPGIWKVTTRGSTHTWDLNRMEYTRLPGPRSGGGAMPGDGQAHRILRVVQWPRVGRRSHVEFDGGATVEWRISSAIIEIRRVW